MPSKGSQQKDHTLCEWKLWSGRSGNSRETIKSLGLCGEGTKSRQRATADKQLIPYVNVHAATPELTHTVAAAAQMLGEYNSMEFFLVSSNSLTKPGSRPENKTRDGIFFTKESSKRSSPHPSEQLNPVVEVQWALTNTDPKAHTENTARRKRTLSKRIWG